jgi:hypothetical protein
MSQPTHDTWDAPPIPLNGDLDENRTYSGVGRVLSGWEAMEAELSHIYSVFVGKFRQDEAYREYGTGRIFTDRMKTLRMAAERYFVSHPNQSREGQFDCLAEIAVKFADRRNEVAHSVVRDLGYFKQLQTSDAFRSQFFLVPSYYNYKRFRSNNMPTYAYTSIELAHLTSGLWVLQGHLAVYRDALLVDIRDRIHKPP